MNAAELRAYQRSLILVFVENQDYKGKRVLDYGCGLATYRRVVEAQKGVWTGFNDGRKPGGSTEMIGDADCLDHDWDVILCTQVLQYVPNVPWLLMDFRRALSKQRGTLVLTYQTNWPEVEPDDLWRFTRTGMEALLHQWKIRSHEQLGDVKFSDEEKAALGYGICAGVP